VCVRWPTGDAAPMAPWDMASLRMIYTLCCLAATQPPQQPPCAVRIISRARAKPQFRHEIPGSDDETGGSGESARAGDSVFVGYPQQILRDLNIGICAKLEGCRVNKTLQLLGMRSRE